MAKKELTKDPGYSIGVVSKLTGIHPETLRMWERRYGIVRPRRSGGRSRRYADEDIRRLALVKTLVDAGHQVSLLAQLSLAQLQTRLEATSPHGLKATRSESRPCRVALLGAALSARLAGAEGKIRDLEIVASFKDEDELMQQGTSASADVLLLECASVQRETLGRVRRLLASVGAPRAVVVYGFGAGQAVRDLEAAGVTCLRAPARIDDIRNACINARTDSRSGAPLSEKVRAEEIPPPRFTSEQLARIAVRVSSIACECPHHLVDLINSMTAFETYSRECEKRFPEDAEVHALLVATAGRARAMLEAALQRVAATEGLELS